MNVIQIKFGHNLPTEKQNELRYRMEVARWKEEWRIAESMGDWTTMGYLNWRLAFMGA